MYIVLNLLLQMQKALLFQLFLPSFLFGNLFVFFLFQGREQIDHHTRTILYSVLLVVGSLGLLLLLVLPAVRQIFVIQFLLSQQLKQHWDV